MACAYGPRYTGLIAGVAFGVALGRRRWWPLLVCVGLCLLATAAAQHAARSFHPRHVGPVEGWVAVASDPALIGNGVRLTLEVQGERFDAWIYGGRRVKALGLAAGEQVWLMGERTPARTLDHRLAVRHVVGRLRIDVLADVRSGNGVARLSNRVRRALRASANATMDASHAALFTGLVIGDDAAQPKWMVDEFRSAGLSHLTAVSGQNVAFILLGASPLLRRLGPWWRWAVTLGLIFWFMALTRFEPSVIRAGVMAGLAATAFAWGGRLSPLRLVAWAVVVVLLADPFLVWSVGLWLSVGATLGVGVLGPRIAAALPGPRWFRTGAGVVLGAQAGVLLPSVAVFHRLPVVSLVANPLAVPVAGVVMLVGLPIGLVAAWLPEWAARGFMAVPVISTRWVALVARVAARAEPTPGWSALCWAFVLVIVLFAMVREWRNRATSAGVPI